MDRMTRDKIIEFLFYLAHKLHLHYSRDIENLIYDIAIEWNDKKLGTEIFVSEYFDDETETAGIMIEDDYFFFNI